MEQHLRVLRELKMGKQLSKDLLSLPFVPSLAEKEQLAPLLVELALRLQLSPSYWSWSSPSSKVEDLPLLRHYMNRFGYISDTGKKLASDLAGKNK
jgi:hypothetical protein